MIPETSTTLLRNVRDAEHPRWPEFVAKYRPMMEAYLKARFPTLEADDIIQETFAALCAILPGYIYDPDEKGHFRNYLIGIVRYKAIEQLKRQKRESDLKARIREQAFEWTYQSRSYRADLTDWQKDAYESALQQFFANPSVSTRDKEIFRRIIRRGEKPEDVAAVFGITRNNVDQIMSRTRSRLKELALQYASVCNG